MRHIGREVALGLVGRDGFLFRDATGLFCSYAWRDVLAFRRYRVKAALRRAETPAVAPSGYP